MSVCKRQEEVDCVVNVFSKIIGERQESLNVLYEKRCVQKGKAIMSDKKYILVDFFEVLPSGRRIKEPKYHTTMSKKSFVPQAIRCLNKQQFV